MRPSFFLCASGLCLLTEGLMGTLMNRPILAVGGQVDEIEASQIMGGQSGCNFYRLFPSCKAVGIRNCPGCNIWIGNDPLVSVYGIPGMEIDCLDGGGLYCGLIQYGILCTL